MRLLNRHKEVNFEKFNPTAKHKDRVVQAWQILIGAAKNRQTLTYELLSIQMYGKKAAGVLDKILGHIAFYCNDNRLPPLTSIVVAKRKGIPGSEIPINIGQTDKLREKVYNYDWYNIYPPTAEELKEAFDNR